MAEPEEFDETDCAVSYTHLDVYKRQVFRIYTVQKAAYVGFISEYEPFGICHPDAYWRGK